MLVAEKKVMFCFRKMRRLQKFFAAHSSIRNHFNLARHLCLRSNSLLNGNSALFVCRQSGAASIIVLAAPFILN